MNIIIDGNDGTGTQKPQELQPVPIGGVSQTGNVNVREPNELSEVIKLINSDEIEPDKRMSTIDLKANLHEIEVNGLVAWDFLVSCRVIPLPMLDFSRQMKRLSVSRDAMGRKDAVKIINGEREHAEETQGGFGNKAKKFFTGKK